MLRVLLLWLGGVLLSTLLRVLLWASFQKTPSPNHKRTTLSKCSEDLPHPRVIKGELWASTQKTTPPIIKAQLWAFWQLFTPQWFLSHTWTSLCITVVSSWRLITTEDPHALRQGERKAISRGSAVVVVRPKQVSILNSGHFRLRSMWISLSVCVNQP